MGDELTVENFVSRMVLSSGDFDLREMELLTADQKYKSILGLLSACEANKDLMPKMMRCAGYMIPHIGSGRRFACLARILEILHGSEHVFGKEVYNLLDFSIVSSLQPLERITLANILTEYIKESKNLLKEVSMWGLIRLIPHMHSVNQKEFANEIFKWHGDDKMSGNTLDCLTSLLYSMNQSDRMDLMMFFADILKSTEPTSDKFFTIDLLERVVAALPSRDRLQLADQVAPLIYFTDTNLVRKAIRFFAGVISLLPSEDRFYYTQMVAGLINDLSVKADVLHAIEKAIPFLEKEEEQSQFKTVLKQYDTIADDGNAEESELLEPAYYYSN